MIEAKSPKPKVRIYGIVRDKDGNPRIEGDPNDLALHIRCMLTRAEHGKLGLGCVSYMEKAVPGAEEPMMAVVRDDDITKAKLMKFGKEHGATAVWFDGKRIPLD